MWLPSLLSPTMSLEGFEALKDLVGDGRVIEFGMASVGEASAYALVWEWGNVRQTKPGPKTVIGTNPDGKMVWLSMQAPFGYIRINENKYWDSIKTELGNVKFDQPNARALERELKRAGKRIADQVVTITKMSVPVDSGDLRDSLKAVYPDDSFLEESGNRFETLVLKEPEE